MAEPIDDSTLRPSGGSLSHTGQGIVIDIGTGDGHFVYRSARENPNRLYIGIDPSPRPLEKISEKIHRNPSRGGAPNALFLQASVEDLPPELDGVADEVHVHFPWGSLLRVMVAGDPHALGGLRRICVAGAMLEVVIGLDPDRDAGEIARLGIEALSVQSIDAVLRPRYAAAGFEIIERGLLSADEWPKLHTSWAKRLRGEGRTVLYLIAQAS